MTETMEVIITAVLASITSTSILGVLLQEFIKRWMNSRFDIELEVIKSRNAEQLAALNAELEGQREMLKRVAQVRMEVFPQICEKLYRAKNELSAQIGQFESVNERFILRSSLRELAEKHGDQVSDACFRYRFLLTDRQFSLLHKYKNQIQTLPSVVAVDEQLNDSSKTTSSLKAIKTALSEQLPVIIAALQTDEPLLRPHAAT